VIEMQPENVADKLLIKVLLVNIPEGIEVRLLQTVKQFEKLVAAVQ
jgi:hypothetical protein